MKKLLSYWYVGVLVGNGAFWVMCIPHLRSPGLQLVAGLLLVAWGGYGLWMVLGDITASKRTKVGE